MGLLCDSSSSKSIEMTPGWGCDFQLRGVRKVSLGRWVAEIRNPVSRAKVFLGSFGTAQEAGRAYDAAAVAIRGPNAPLNFAAAHQVQATKTATLKARLGFTGLSFRKRTNLYDDDNLDTLRLKRQCSLSSVDSEDDDVEQGVSSALKLNPFHLLSEQLDALTERAARESVDSGEGSDSNGDEVDDADSGNFSFT